MSGHSESGRIETPTGGHGFTCIAEPPPDIPRAGQLARMRIRGLYPRTGSMR